MIEQQQQQQRVYQILVTGIAKKFSLWSNGIVQNTIFFTQLVNHIPGFKAYLGYVDEVDVKDQSCFADLPDTLNLTPHSKLNNYEYDVIVQMGYGIPHDQLLRYKEKYPKVKIVSYICGCPFIMDGEHIIYNKDEKDVKFYNSRKIMNHFDQIWIIPQNENTSLEYAKEFFSCEKGTVVPFVWDPCVSTKYLQRQNLEEYQLFRPIEKVAIMEPNLSLIKNSLIPILLCENYVQLGGELKFIYMVCADKMGANKTLMQVIKDTKLMKQKKISVEHRHATLGFLNRFADAVICFQMGNPLNYLYLDIAWWGFPVIHNAHLCPDVGYYYPDFGLQQGSQQLKKVIDEHPFDATYKDRMRKTISRYTYKNPQILKDYHRLFMNVLNDSFEKFEYNWETNGIHSAR